jgi:hypothetical protein
MEYTLNKMVSPDSLPFLDDVPLLGDVVLKKDPVNGREFLEYSERMTKTRDGTGKENRKVKPRLYGNGTERDPLEL